MGRGESRSRDRGGRRREGEADGTQSVVSQGTSVAGVLSAARAEAGGRGAEARARRKRRKVGRGRQEKGKELEEDEE